jgi:hypothetical protein
MKFASIIIFIISLFSNSLSEHLRSYYSHKDEKVAPKRWESKGERTTRELLETRLGKKFPKIRPNWLRGKKGRNLEIDGYCEELKLGFEYNGQQHYDPNSFNGTPEKFLEQILRDKYKYTTFLQRGIRCIILENIIVNKIENEIARQLEMIDENLYNKFIQSELSE